MHSNDALSISPHHRSSRKDLCASATQASLRLMVTMAMVAMLMNILQASRWVKTRSSMNEEDFYDFISNQRMDDKPTRQLCSGLPCPPIDAVIPWVNGTEPKRLSELQKYSLRKEDSSAKRYRDLGELRYALRSIHTYAPWIRKIFLVVSDKNRQVPYWLDKNHPRITIVEHLDIWEDPSLLPTFDSNKIDCHFHRIPGLSDDFLYFNDDMMLTRPLSLYGDLWNSTAKETIFYLESFDFHTNLTLAKGWHRVLASTHNLFVQKYGERSMVKGHKRQFAHTPYFYNKKIWNEMRSKAFKKEYDSFLFNGSKFRAEGALQTQTMYGHYLMWNLMNQTNSTYPYNYVVKNAKTSLYGFAITHNRTMIRRNFEKARNSTKRFLTVQDELGGWVDHAVLKEIHLGFEKIFPAKAPWELDRSSSSVQ